VSEAFEEWCEKKWHVLCHWAVVPCPVNVSPSCMEKALAAYPEGADVWGACIKIASQYYDELATKFWSGQVKHELTGAMQGTWFVLLHLGMLYVDDREHPVANKVRREVQVVD
jgi:hypothetical protein